MEAEVEESPVCARCKATSSLMWNKREDGKLLCLECHRESSSKTTKDSSSSSSETSSQNGQPNASTATSGNNNSTSRRTTRQSERASKAKLNKGSGEKPKSSSNNTGTRGGQQKSRRNVVKQQKPMKAPKSQATIVTSDSIIHKGTTYEVGDIVSVLDRDGGVYYAIIRGFLQDQYAEKFAVLTWLLPTQPNPTHFDPSIFVLGPEEDSPRAMDYLEFVCHSPQSRHFQASYFHNLEGAELWRAPTKHNYQLKEGEKLEMSVYDFIDYYAVCVTLTQVIQSLFIINHYL